MSANKFAPATIRSKHRYYLVRIEKTKDNAVVQKEDFVKAIAEMYQQLFGTYYLNLLPMDVYDQGNDRFIVDTTPEFAVTFRTALTLPSPHQSIHKFEVISESSYLQPLIHDSRLFYPPLI
ncbi:hypothetical protein TVAG_039900 [Trichomonas vaginalis G3]|uniref:Uncharacterized protein n=1 Tax=Trichomonas vaginalis (strain ATCC PRA-98 / G3) TaxID=412133 RepID=A2EQW4_TRIV3|nr:hypothetical protein TVAGG3_0693880 [Trichomonas vaginalis G3]EAY04938.1 hypothetical protein TVAG_039900 [Trichomonas vaginalis G3]KAI5508778.1 hypothetical protein TVAGG3_0693880 [Trichomonas vaginalis G3]|eukprot:XP_001317161.1 hypothetical protein [Trichomonas vaginalis G3]